MLCPQPASIPRQTGSYRDIKWKKLCLEINTLEHCSRWKTVIFQISTEIFSKTFSFLFIMKTMQYLS